MQNHNTYPYFDDSQDAFSKGYHKILFVPGNPVQARELTQIQSMLQEQVKRFGDHMFKNGTKVTGGDIFYDNDVVSIKLNPVYNSYTVATFGAELIGRTLVGQTSGVEAHVIHFEPATKTEPNTIFVKYTSANGDVVKFSSSEILSQADLNVDMQIQSGATAIGGGAIVTINEGIFFVNGYFIGIDKQVLVLSKYSKTPSNIVGLQLNETIVTSSSDDALLDNAIGFPNYAAPGAHRYKLELKLVAKSVAYEELEGQESIHFISQLKVVGGVIQYMYNDTKYAEVEKMLARRTFDESGDYIVKDFTVQVLDYRSDNRGNWSASTPYIKGDIIIHSGKFYVAKNNGFSGNTAPTHAYGEASDGGIYWLQTSVPMFNNGVYTAKGTTLQQHLQEEAKTVVRTSSGKAYVKGFEVNVQDTRFTEGSKAREFNTINNQQIYAPVGTYAKVNTVTGIVDTSTMTKVNLKNPANAVIGTAWATNLEYVSGTIGTAGAIYKLYLMDIQMQAGNDFVDDVLTVESSVGSTFSATFVQQTQILSGVVTVANASAVVVGKGTLFTQELSPGDQIDIGGVSKTVASIQNDITLTVNSNFSAVQTNVNILLKYVSLNGNEQYIQKLPHEYVRSMRKDDGTIDTEYTVQKTIPFTSTGASHVLTLTAVGETFIPTGHIVVNTTSRNVIDAGYSLSLDAKELTITGLSAANHKIIAVVKRVGSSAREKIKTLVTKTITITATNIKDENGNVITTGWNYTSPEISLTECDVQRIVKITMSGAAGAYNATGESNVTNWFVLHPNQFSYAYGISKIHKINPALVIAKELKVTFEYFEHSVGDYFSVDSYASIPYERIPSVKLNDGKFYHLSDCMDFRSRVADDGLSYSGSGGNVSTPIYSGSTISTSLSYYLPRVDVLSLSKSGEFEYITGISKINPKVPNVSDGSLIIATLNVPPYTFNTKEVGIVKSTYRRFTMQDISKIDDRLSNVEYYVALNELERSTAQSKVLDANGLERFKNGFIADNFTTNDVADVQSSEFRATMDSYKKELCPQQSTQLIDLVEFDGVTPTSRLTAGYKVTGDWITLPYTEVPLVSQLIATRDEFINPFAVFTWNGVLKITPEKDDWVETRNITNVHNIVGNTTVINQTNTINSIVQSWNNWSNWGWGWVNGRWVSSWVNTTRSTSTSTRQAVTTSRSTSSVSVDIPWMRSLPIVCELIGMRPFTNLNAFIDSVNVNAKITNSIQLTITGEVGRFLGYKDISPSNTFSMKRNIQTLDEYAGFTHPNILAKGEVIRFTQVGTPNTIVTALVLSREVQVNAITKATETVLHVVLPRQFSLANAYIGVGTLAQGVVITGEESGATATVSAVTTPATLQTNSNGNLFCILTPSSFTFTTGEHDIKFMDSPIGDEAASVTMASVPFTSRGKYTINTTDVTNRIDTFVTNITTVRNTRTTVRRWHDPLAQTFIIPAEKTQGCFVTSVDIWFSVKALGETQPVRVEICEAVNGYPGPDPLYNAEAIVQAADIVATTNASVATNFRFPGPVYLENSKEYCLKVLSNSVKYKIFIAQMGQAWIQDPTKSVGAQPHLGVLFKSQNNSTWTADQMQDMMFRINQAKFDISRSGFIQLRNKHTGVSMENLVPEPFSIVNGSAVVKVYQPNHGLSVNLYVDFSGSTYTNMNGRFVVKKVVNPDVYEVQMGSNAASTENVGGSAVKSSKNIRYDNITFDIGQDYSMRQGTNIVPAIKQTNSTRRDTITTPLQLGVPYDNIESKYIHSDLNEALILGGASSVVLDLNIYSNNADLSPCINREAIRAITVANRINNPVKTDSVVVVDDVTLTNALAGITFTAATKVIGIPTSFDIAKFQIGSYITISGTASNNIETMIKDIDKTTNPFSVYVGNALVNETPATTTIVQHNGFVDEIAPSGGSVAAKYLHRKMQLETPATSIKLMFAASVPTGSTLEAYYRTGITSSGKAIEDTVWTKITLNYTTTAGEIFVDQEYTLNSIPSFNLCQVKLVMKSTDPAIIPKAKDLRIICLA